MRQGRWVSAVAVAVVMCAAACATGRRDVTGSGDERLDEAGASEAEAGAIAKAGARCGEAGGDLLLLDARTGDPVSCVPVTLLRDAAGCEPQPGEACPTEQVAEARTTAQGELALPDRGLLEARLWVVAGGYGQSSREPEAVKPGTPAEVEMIPEDGFLLKFVDQDGNYLPRISVSFRQGGELIAQMRANDLANVFFHSRTPFAGEPVTIEAEGFEPVTIFGPGDPGRDGNTVTLRRRVAARQGP